MLAIDLKGKVALVTGATGQLGRTMIRTLAEAGADVVICYNQNAEKAEQLKTEVQQKYGVRAMAAKVDITDLDSTKQLRQEVNQQLGTVDILVNCAASSTEWKPILQEELKNYYDHFETTVIHNVAMIKAFVPDMIEKGYGRVIGINTECAMQCFETQSAYAAGKRGMDGIYRVLAKEISSHGITVNQVAPGWTISEREREIGDQDEKADYYYTNRVPMKRRGTDYEIANAVAFLASDLASFINGVYLPVCGGNVIPGI